MFNQITIMQKIWDRIVFQHRKTVHIALRVEGMGEGGVNGAPAAHFAPGPPVCLYSHEDTISNQNVSKSLPSAIILKLIEMN